MRGLWCCASALLFYLAFPNVCDQQGFVLGGWVFAIPLFLALAGRSFGQRLMLGLLWGLVAYGLQVSWLWSVTPIGYFLLVSVLALQSVIFAILLGISPVIRWVRILFIPSAWVLSETLRAWVMGGFSWQVGHSQASDPCLIQLAAWFGVNGVSWVLILANVLIFEAWQDRGFRRQGLFLAFALFLGASLFGVWRLSRDAGVASIVQVGAVQPNILRTFQNDDHLYDQNIERHMALTDQLVYSQKVDLIVWPESSFSDDVTLDPQWRVRMEEAARSWRTPILFGSVMRAGMQGTNSALMLSDEGLWQDRYDKRKLVPFGEYIPKGPLMPRAVAAMGAGTHDLVSGHIPGVMFLPVKKGQLPFGVAICSEEAYPLLFRDMARQGVGFFVVMLNDAWFSRPEALRIHGSFAVLRAVETGRAVVRVGNTGWTTAIDGHGRSIGEGPLLQSAGWRVFDLPLNQGQTPFVRFGFFFPLVCGMFVIIILILQFRNRQRVQYDV